MGWQVRRMRRVDPREMPLDSGLPVSGQAAQLGNEFAEISRVDSHLEATAYCDYAIGLGSRPGAGRDMKSRCTLGLPRVLRPPTWRATLR